MEEAIHALRASAPERTCVGQTRRWRAPAERMSPDSPVCPCMSPSRVSVSRRYLLSVADCASLHSSRAACTSSPAWSAVLAVPRYVCAPCVPCRACASRPSFVCQTKRSVEEMGTTISRVTEQPGTETSAIDGMSPPSACQPHTDTSSTASPSRKRKSKTARNLMAIRPSTFELRHI